jgi:hypothetical protein
MDSFCDVLIVAANTGYAGDVMNILKAIPEDQVQQAKKRIKDLHGK